MKGGSGGKKAFGGRGRLPAASGATNGGEEPEGAERMEKTVKWKKRMRGPLSALKNGTGDEEGCGVRHTGGESGVHHGRTGDQKP
jgi:hypothetical protein